MKDYVLLVQTNPVAGREDEFNRWYNEIHVKDVLAAPGMRAARRYQLVRPDAANAPALRYLARYEFSTDDPSALMRDLRSRMDSGQMQLTDSLDTSAVVMTVYEAVASEQPAPNA